MKITRTTTMEQLKKALGANAVAVKEADTNLYEQMVYTSKAMKEGKKVTKKDLADLVKDVMKVLGDKFVEPVLAEEAPATKNTKDVEKKAPVKKETVKKAAPAKKAAVKETLHVQFSGKTYTTEDLVKIAKDVWKYDLNKDENDFKTVELYVKPEESAVYYVINDDVKGSFGI